MDAHELLQGQIYLEFNIDRANFQTLARSAD